LVQDAEPAQWLRSPHSDPPTEEFVMSVTAKVKVTSKVPYNQGTEHEQHTIGFQPDYTDGRNQEWAVATPALSLSMSVKPDVAKRFEVGQAFTLTFEPTED
jgi:hypothetical protein